MALMPVADALAAILAGAEPMGEEMVALEAAHHRVLARDVAARRTQPPQAMSAMDGYAVRAADASKVQAKLKVIGEVAAGRPFDRALGVGEAARIFTGGVIPDGADAVVIQEDTLASGNCITINEAAVAGRHIRPAGVDFREGDVLLSGGRRLTERDLSLAASMNYPELPVRRRPKVALLATGDELVMPGSTPGPGQIVYSNGYALRALARAEGADTVEPMNSQSYLAHVAARAVILIEADDPVIGLMAFVPVGMVEVSSCMIDSKVMPGYHVGKGAELGYFQYGGSTHCLVFRPGAIAEFALAAIPQPHDPKAPLMLVRSKLAIASTAA